MLIEKIKTKQLIPAEYNPRKDLKPGDPEYEKLKRSLEEFGYVEPVIWNKTTGRVIGGHQRLKILLSMGMDFQTLMTSDDSACGLIPYYGFYISKLLKGA